MNKLDLSKSAILGYGNERICYSHPTIDARCVKVNRPGITHRYQNKIEYYYFRRLLAREVPFTYLPTFYGKVNTNFGIGLVFERVKNEDGSDAIKFVQAIEQGDISKEKAYDILNTLYDYCYEYGICIGDLNQDQILLKYIDNKPIPMIIDGIGTRRLGPKLILMSYSKFFSRRKLKKSYATLLRKLQL